MSLGKLKVKLLLQLITLNHQPLVLILDVLQSSSDTPEEGLLLLEVAYLLLIKFKLL